MTYKLQTLLCCMFFLNGCGSISNNSVSELTLEQNDWNLLSYGFQMDEKNNLLDNTSFSLYFNMSQVSGNDGCNDFGGSYELNGNNLSIQMITATQMLCLVVGNQQEHKAQTDFIQNAFTTAQNFIIEDSVLTITSNDRSQLIFEVAND